MDGEASGGVESGQAKQVWWVDVLGAMVIVAAATGVIYLVVRIGVDILG